MTSSIISFAISNLINFIQFKSHLAEVNLLVTLQNVFFFFIKMYTCTIAIHPTYCAFQAGEPGARRGDEGDPRLFTENVDTRTVGETKTLLKHKYIHRSLIGVNPGFTSITMYN